MVVCAAFPGLVFAHECASEYVHVRASLLLGNGSVHDQGRCFVVARVPVTPHQTVVLVSHYRTTLTTRPVCHFVACDCILCFLHLTDARLLTGSAGQV